MSLTKYWLTLSISILDYPWKPEASPNAIFHTANKSESSKRQAKKWEKETTSLPDKSIFVTQVDIEGKVSYDTSESDQMDETGGWQEKINEKTNFYDGEKAGSGEKVFLCHWTIMWKRSPRIKISLVSCFVEKRLWARKCENVFKNQRIASRLKLDFPVSIFLFGIRVSSSYIEKQIKI